jgi:hypothetical protein
VFDGSQVASATHAGCGTVIERGARIGADVCVCSCRVGPTAHSPGTEPDIAPGTVPDVLEPHGTGCAATSPIATAAGRYSSRGRSASL